MGKSKKTKNAAKPPLQKRRSKAVLSVMKKQEKIRKNFINKGSFCQTSSRNCKSNLFDNTRKSFKNRSSTRKSQVSVRNEGDHKISKSQKHFKISRKEARAKIGLQSIPDEKIEEFMKVKKTKEKPQVLPHSKKLSNNNPVPTFQYQGKNRSRQSQEHLIKHNKSGENNRVRVRETLKIRFPEAKAGNERINGSTIESSKYEND